MHRSSLIKQAALLGAVLASLGFQACGGTSTQPSSASEADAKADRALESAKRENTIAAYEVVMQRFSGTDAAGLARIEVARLSAEMARVALGRGDLQEARLLSSQAVELGDPLIARSAQTTLDQVDRADSRIAADRVKHVLDTDSSLPGCSKAINIVGTTFGDTPSALLARDLRTATLQQLSGCIQSAIDAAKPTDDFAPVRKLIDDGDTKRALGQDTQFALLTQLNDAVVAAMIERTEKDVAAGRWTEAFAVFDTWGKEGKASVQQVEAAKNHTRDIVTTKLLAQGRKALGTRNAERTRQDVQRALDVFKGMNIVPEFERLRDHLMASVECNKLRCMAERNPRIQHNFGSAPIYPMTSSSAAPTSKVPNGTKLWLLARSPSFSLVSTKDPGSLSSWEERLSAAQGWIETSTLKNEDTSAWLPVGPALVGERVWLPTGRDDNLFLLGIVRSVDGQDVTVEKISDGQPTTLNRSDLRSGILSQGTKVLAFCRDTHNLTESRFESVVEGDGRAPRGNITCLTDDGADDRARQEQLGALRAKVEWLPARRP